MLRLQEENRHLRFQLDQMHTTGMSFLRAWKGWGQSLGGFKSSNALLLHSTRGPWSPDGLGPEKPLWDAAGVYAGEREAQVKQGWASTGLSPYSFLLIYFG